MGVPREIKIHAVKALREVEMDARQDLAEGFEPESIDEQWESAVDLLDEREHTELLLIALINAGLVRGVPTSGLDDDPWNLVRPECPTYRYGGLTEEGRRLADQREQAANN
jgi:hypothetical protein